MDKARDLLEGLKEEQKLEAKLAEQKNKNSKMKLELFDEMLEKDMDSITIEGIKLEPKLEENYAINKIDGFVEAWDDPAVHEWFQLHNMKDIIKTKSAIHPATRLANLKSYVESGGELPEFIRLSTFSSIKYNKQAVKRLV